jgi:hypothetical protein
MRYLEVAPALDQLAQLGQEILHQHHHHKEMQAEHILDIALEANNPWQVVVAALEHLLQDNLHLS